MFPRSRKLIVAHGVQHLAIGRTMERGFIVKVTHLAQKWPELHTTCAKSSQFQNPRSALLVSIVCCGQFWIVSHHIHGKFGRLPILPCRVWEWTWEHMSQRWPSNLLAAAYLKLASSSSMTEESHFHQVGAHLVGHSTVDQMPCHGCCTCLSNHTPYIHS